MRIGPLAHAAAAPSFCVPGHPAIRQHTCLSFTGLLTTVVTESLRGISLQNTSSLLDWPRLPHTAPLTLITGH